MKKYNSFKKTVAVLMSLSIICAPSITLNVCAAENSSQYVSEADADDVDKSALYDALYNYVWFEGFNLTVEYYENVKAAEEMALKVYNNPDATQAEVDEATAVLVETRYNFIECNWQDELIGRYYEYGAYVKKNYSDLLSEDNKSALTDYVLNAQIAICYENDPEYIDNLTNELKDFYMTLVPETENKDFVTGEEAVNIYSLVDEYYNNISATPDEPDYYVDVPVFKYFSNGYRIINTGYNNADVDEGKLVERINGYIYQVSQYGSLSPFGYLAVNTETGDVLTLDEALEQKIISGSEMCECLKENSPSYLMSVYLIGDADSDGSLSVSDATYIQKIIVGKAEDKSDLSYSSVSDFNDDGRIDVTDVTEIQKQIVGVNDL